MEKMQVIKTTNVILFISFLIQTVTGLFLLLDIGGPLEDFMEESHEFNGLFLVVLLIMHVYLYWPAIKSHYFKKKTT